jgi:hypothetical protein
LAAIHRICQPGPKTEVADWYDRTVLQPLWGFPAERFTSQAFWDCFETLAPEQPAPGANDELEQAQLRLLGLWKQKQLVSRRLLGYDTTNFYTYIASTNTQNHLAQRGHNKQGRHNLRQVGLSYVLDGEHGLSLCHHVYAGDIPDVEEFSVALARMLRMLDQNQIGRETVTLVFDKGSAALANTVELEQAQVGWIAALPWNQAPAELRERALEQLPACSSDQPGVHAAGEKMLVHGKEYLCVVKYSASFLGEQLHSVTTGVSKVLQYLRRLSIDLSKPKARWTETQIRNKIQRWLSAQFMADLIHYQLDWKDGHWHLQFDFDHAAWLHLMAHRLGRTVLLTNRKDWSAEQVAAAYSGQQHVEQVFRGLKDGEWLGWGPMHHWTDSKIRVHAFYCMLGISPAAIRAPPSPSSVGWDLDGRVAGRVAPDPRICPPLSSTGRQGTESSRHSALQTNTAAAGTGQDAGPGPPPYYPAWVIRRPARNPLRKQLLIPLFWSFAVNSR